MRCLAVLVFASLLASPVLADTCMRLAHGKNEPKVLDPPGSFGPLHETVSLGCLKFIGTEKQGEKLLAVIIDERGKTFRVAPGDYLGENSGRITEITEKRIALNQVVRAENGEWIELPRYVFRASPK